MSSVGEGESARERSIDIPADTGDNRLILIMSTASLTEGHRVGHS